MWDLLVPLIVGASGPATLIVKYGVLSKRRSRESIARAPHDGHDDDLLGKMLQELVDTSKEKEGKTDLGYISVQEFDVSGNPARFCHDEDWDWYDFAMSLVGVKTPRALLKERDAEAKAERERKAKLQQERWDREEADRTRLRNLQRAVRKMEDAARSKWASKATSSEEYDKERFLDLIRAEREHDRALRRIEAGLSRKAWNGEELYSDAAAELYFSLEKRYGHLRQKYTAQATWDGGLLAFPISQRSREVSTPKPPTWTYDSMSYVRTDVSEGFTEGKIVNVGPKGYWRAGGVDYPVVSIKHTNGFVTYIIQCSGSTASVTYRKERVAV